MTRPMFEHETSVKASCCSSPVEARLAPIVAEVCFSVKKEVCSMVRKVILVFSGVLSLVLIAVEWPIVVPVVHILLGH